MTNKLISDLPLATALTGPEILETTQGGVSSQVTATQIAAFSNIGMATVVYVDAGDASGLASAKSYADSGDASTLTTAKDYTDTKSVDTLTSANAYTDSTGATNLSTAKAYADSLVVGLFDYRGVFSAAGSLFPSSGGSGTAGAVLKGDVWVINTAGTIAGEAFNAGDSIFATIDTPGQTLVNWGRLDSNLGYTPENAANKATVLTTSNNTLYPTVLAVNNALALKTTDSTLAAVAKSGQKADVGLSNVDNTTDMNKPVSTAQATADTNTLNSAKAYTDSSVATNQAADRAYADSRDATTLTSANNYAIAQDTTNLNTAKSYSDAGDTTTLNSAKAYADGLVVGLYDDRGNYDASTNTFPTALGSGTSGAVLKGDLWLITVAGSLGGTAVRPGDTIRALVNAPGQTLANWGLMQGDLGFVPENVANKATVLTTSNNTLYPTVLAVNTALALKTTDTTLAVVAKSGLYSDLLSKPTLLAVGNATPLAAGTATPGSSVNASSEDHVHPLSTLGALGAEAVANKAVNFSTVNDTLYPSVKAVNDQLTLKVNTSAVGTIAAQNASTVAITGGAIDATTIGATTTASGKFTTLSATGATTVAAITATSLNTVLATITGGTIDATPIGNTTVSTGKFTTINSTGATTLNSLSTANATLTGGAISSMSINGTPVGATTPSTGAFTTLGATGTSTLSAVTATTLNTSGAATVSSLVTAGASITGGTINGTAIGGTSAAAGSFTTLSATSATTLGTVSATSITTASATLTGGTINSTPIGATTASTGAFTTLGASGVSTLAATTVTTLGASGTSTLAGVTATSVISTSGAIGYGTGAGGLVTQATSKSTGVTLNKAAGKITLNNESLAGNTAVAFTFTNSFIAAVDVVTVSINSGASAMSYLVSVDSTATGSCSIVIRNMTTGALGEAVAINFAIVKGAIS